MINNKRLSQSYEIDHNTYEQVRKSYNEVPHLPMFAAVFFRTPQKLV